MFWVELVLPWVCADILRQTVMQGKERRSEGERGRGGKEKEY